ncbi:MAG TPA: hypothetical protein VGC90_05270 [Candidatus Limnocylindrales bacterium]|jgi:hypothetical protein
MPDGTARTLRLEIEVTSDADIEALEGALLAAKATELAEAHRRSARHAFGYGSDTARDTMSDEVEHRRRRVTMLERVIAALRSASRD